MDRHKKTLEERQAEARARNKIRRFGKPKVKGHCYEKYDFDKCLEVYRPEFDEIVDMVMATCRSQTKQSSPKKSLEYLSQKILYLTPYIDAKSLDREDVEQELRKVWWICYQKCREKKWSLKTNFLKYAAYFLPRYIKPHISSVNRTNTDDISYELDLVEPFEINLDYVINGSEAWPACLFDRQERYLIFLLTEHPGEYAKCARIMRLSRVKIWNMVREIRARLSQECDYYASQNTARSSERGIAISA